MPVFDACGNLHCVTGMKLLRFLAPLLIEAASGDSDEDLTAALEWLKGEA